MKLERISLAFLGCAAVIMFGVCWFQFARPKTHAEEGYSGTRDGLRVPSSPLLGFKNNQTKGRLRENLDKPEASLEKRVFESNAARKLIEDWKNKEASGAKFIKSLRARESQVIVLLPAVSEAERTLLTSRIEDILNNTGGGDSEIARDAVKRQLLAWFLPNVNETVVIFDLVNIDHAGSDYLDGRWFEIEDPSKIKDEFQYMNYGKILNSGTIPENVIRERFDHLFKLAVK